MCIWRLNHWKFGLFFFFFSDLRPYARTFPLVVGGDVIYCGTLQPNQMRRTLTIACNLNPTCKPTCAWSFEPLTHPLHVCKARGSLRRGSRLPAGSSKIFRSWEFETGTCVWMRSLEPTVIWLLIGWSSWSSLESFLSVRNTSTTTNGSSRSVQMQIRRSMHG